MQGMWSADSLYPLGLGCATRQLWGRVDLQLRMKGLWKVEWRSKTRSTSCPEANITYGGYSYFTNLSFLSFFQEKRSARIPEDMLPKQVEKEMEEVYEWTVVDTEMCCPSFLKEYISAQLEGSRGQQTAPIHWLLQSLPQMQGARASLFEWLASSD